MNHVYQLIWNDLTATYVATPERTRSRGKRSRAAKALAVAATLGVFTQVHAAPTGGQISAGSGNISQSSAITTITQSSQKLAINWNTFGVAANETVNFVQPNRSAIALNRVLGTDGSQILGKLNANGQVFILNPNGVLFGSGSQVNVGGLLASTLQLSDSNFLAGKYTFSGNGGSVINQGQITAADGGYVALIGNQVSNQGTVIAKLGTVALAAGQQVSLDFAGDGLLSLTVDQSAVNALVTNKGLIQADGGYALMTAHAKDALLSTVVNNEGIIQARTVENHNGVIKLLGNMDSGTVRVGGALDASAPNGGSGGFIDTSGAHVAIEPHIKVTTLAANGKTGTWLIDPNDYKIAASGGDITGTLLSSQLGSNNISILSSSGGTAGNGDIFVNDAVSWAANTSLTLSAYRNIEVNSNITATGNTAGLTLTPGTGTAGDYNLNNGAKITLSGSTPSLSIAGHAYTVINDVNALQAMNNNLAGYYALGSDIDASVTSGWNGGAGFVPIGVATSWSSIPGASGVEDILVVLASNWAGNTHFANEFAGLGHVISNLSINRPATNSVGLFGSAGPNAVIRDIGVTNVGIVGSTYIGGLVGWNYGLIKDSFVSGVVTTGNAPHTGNNNSYVGGMIGYNWGHIRDSWTTGSVYGSNQYAGGLIGLNQGFISASLGALGSVSNSYSSANVSGSGGSFGGLIGNNGGVISSSYASGNVTGGTSSIYLGGLIGSNGNNVSNSYATGNVTSGDSSQMVGGLMGDSQNSLTTVSNSYASGRVSVGTGSIKFGGLVGSNTGTFTNSYWDTQTSGQATSAGGAGKTTSQLMTQATFGGWDFSSNWWMSEGNTRPLLRTEYSTNITNAHQLQLMVLNLGANYKLANDISMAELTQASGVWNTSKGFYPIGLAITSNTGTPFTGLIDGQNYAISNLVINRPTMDYVGLFGDTSPSSIIKNIGLIEGAVTGHSIVGSLVGRNNTGLVTNSYASTDVTATKNYSFVGGLVGYNQYGTILDSHATGTVTGGITGSEDFTYVGGLVGLNTGTITRTYATGNVSGNSRIGGLVGESQAGTIGYSYATGNVTSGLSSFGIEDWAGGLVGANGDLITNSYATGAVSGRTWVGGLVGGLSNAWSNAVVLNSYSTGLVSGSSVTGGLVGFSQQGVVTNSYWNTQTSGQTTSAGGTGLTSALMKTAAAYSGWDIATAGGSSSIWRIYEGEAMPLLRSYLTPQSITAVAADTKVYSESGYSGGNGYTSTGADGSMVLYGGSAQGARNVGNYDIRLYSHQLGYDLTGTLSNALTITPADLTLTTANVTKTYDGGNSASGSAIVKTGSGTELFSSDSLTGGSYAFTNPNAGSGNKTVTVTGVTVNDGNGGNNYTISYANNATSTIDKAPLTVTADNKTRLYGDVNPTFTSTITGYVNGENATTANVNGTPALSTTATTTTGVGTAAINSGANSLAAANYDFSYVNGLLTIDKAPLTVTADNKNREYGDANPALTATATGLKGADTNAILTGLSTAALNGSNTGSYVIDASHASAGSNYTITLATNGTLTITPAPLTVSADDKTKIQTQPNPTLTASIGGFKLGQDQSVLGGALALKTTAGTNSPAGNFPITASGLTSANYTIRFVDGNLKVISVTNPSTPGAPEHGYGGAINNAHGSNPNHHDEGKSGRHEGNAYAFGKSKHKDRDERSGNDEREEGFARNFEQGSRMQLSGLPVTLEGSGVSLPGVAGNRRE